MYGHSLFPVQPWESAAVQASGLSASQLRFAISFLLSIAVGAILRYIPTPKCEQERWCGRS